MAGQRPRKIPEAAYAPAPGDERTAPTPRRLVTAPEQHARDWEVGEAADAPRHQFQLRFRHGRVRVGGREEVGISTLNSRQSRGGTRAERPRWAGLLGAGWSSTRGGTG